MTPQELETWWGHWTPEHHLADYLDTNGGGREGGGVAEKTMADDG